MSASALERRGCQPSSRRAFSTVATHILVGRAVVPLGERREPGEVERPERGAGETGRHGHDRARRGRVRDQRREIGPHRARSRRPDVERLPHHRLLAREDDGVGQVVDVDELIAVGPAAERVHAPTLPNPLEQDPEGAEAPGAHDCAAAGGSRPRDRGARTPGIRPQPRPSTPRRRRSEQAEPAR